MRQWAKKEDKEEQWRHPNFRPTINDVPWGRCTFYFADVICHSAVEWGTVVTSKKRRASRKKSRLKMLQMIQKGQNSEFTDKTWRASESKHCVQRWRHFERFLNQSLSRCIRAHDCTYFWGSFRSEWGGSSVTRDTTQDDVTQEVMTSRHDEQHLPQLEASLQWMESRPCQRCLHFRSAPPGGWPLSVCARSTLSCLKAEK